jgi:hypothetical protein
MDTPRPIRAVAPRGRGCVGVRGFRGRETVSVSVGVRRMGGVVHRFRVVVTIDWVVI